MPKVLYAGIAPELALDVTRRLPGVTHAIALDAEAALQQLATGTFDALVIDHDLPGKPAVDVLAQARGQLDQATLKVVAVLPREADSLTIMRLVNELRVDHLLFRPVDLQALVGPVGAALGVQPGLPPEEKRPAVAGGVLASLWAKFREATMKRVAVLDQAAQALIAGKLELTVRHEAEREAHKLRGALGTFGFPEGSRIAAELEQHLGGELPLTPDHGRLIAELLVALRAELSQPVGGDAAGGMLGGGLNAAAPGAAREKRILLVEDDDLVAAAVMGEGEARGFRMQRATGVAGARAAIALRRPDVAIVDLGLGPDGPDGRTLLAELATHDPPIATVVLTARATIVERLETARLGSVAFIEKPAPSAAVIDAAARAMAPATGNAPRVLAVDDDPAILGAIEALLTPRGIHVMTLDDPLTFWHALEAHQPDLVMLDIDMPFLTGFELCRVLRNDLRWRGVPVLFLTARTDPASVQRMFAAGGDDYIAKPILGPELTTRIANRLERMRLVRRLGEEGMPPGVTTRAEGMAVLERLLRLGQRQARPLAIAILELTGLPPAEEGGAAADRARKRASELVGRFLADEDLVSAWDGGRLLVAAYEASREALVRRVDALRAQLLVEAGGGPGPGVAAGVAASPGDGQDLPAVERAALQALEAARAGGPGRTVVAGAPAV